MLVAGIIIAIMYLGLVLSIAEMSPALPHTGAAYSFARTAIRPWGGFVTGLFENVAYVIAPAVICTFVALYQGHETDATPEGVAYATTRTVVISSLAVLGMDFILTALMFSTP